MIEQILFSFGAALLIGLVVEGVRENIIVAVFGGAADTTGIHAAITDTGASQSITSGIKNPPFDTRISATAGGTGADIGAIQIVIIGKDTAGNALTESLPIFTANTAATKIGSKVFRTITSITVPAHDGTGATTAIGYDGAPKVATAAGVHAAVTDNGSEQTITTGFADMDVPRTVTATSGGTGTDIKAIQVVVSGFDSEGIAMSETLPIFTVNSATTVVGAKAFKRVTQVVIPAHDGTAATTAIGFSDIIGLGVRKKRKTILSAFLAEVLEGTAPAELFDATNLYGNTFDLNSALNSTKVKIEFVSTNQ